ncbi:MAG TPA: hypothetical protein PLW14_05100 [Chlorobiota bacterium]|nr:hypothetical protein [Chlorobiota bacterium]
MVTALKHPLKLLCTFTACVAVLASCGGTHGRIGSVWIDLPADTVVNILMQNEILSIHPVLEGVGGQGSTYLMLPVSSASQEFDTIRIHVTIDIVQDGVTGCYLSLIGYMPKGTDRYCMQDKCTSEQDEAALRLFEAIVLNPLRRHIRIGELET